MHASRSLPGRIFSNVLVRQKKSEVTISAKPTCQTNESLGADICRFNRHIHGCSGEEQQIHFPSVCDVFPDGNFELKEIPLREINGHFHSA
jgi:hypothetical protein